MHIHQHIVRAWTPLQQGTIHQSHANNLPCIGGTVVTERAAVWEVSPDESAIGGPRLLFVTRGPPNPSPQHT